jgi:hypothetical protein
MERAFVLALTQEIERLRNEHKDCDKRIIQSEWDFLEHNANLSMYLNGERVHYSSWYYDDIVITTYASEGSEHTEDCSKFATKMNLPADTRSVSMHLKNSEHPLRMSIAHGTATIGSVTLYDKDGFDIIWQLVNYRSDRGHPIPIESLISNWTV